MQNSKTCHSYTRQVGKNEKHFKVPGKTLNVSSHSGICPPLAIMVRVSRLYQYFPQVLHAYIPKVTGKSTGKKVMQINVLGMKFRSLKIHGSFAASFSRARFHVQLTKQVTDVHIRPLPDSMHGSTSWQRELSLTFLKS